MLHLANKDRMIWDFGSDVAGGIQIKPYKRHAARK